MIILAITRFHSTHVLSYSQLPFELEYARYHALYQQIIDPLLSPYKLVVIQENQGPR